LVENCDEEPPVDPPVVDPPGGGTDPDPVDDEIPEENECYEAVDTGIVDGDRMKFFFGSPRNFLGVDCSPDFDVIYSSSQ
jgi:hypothetical protein